MTRDKIHKINVERLGRWKNKLVDNHATPVMLLGVGHDHKEGELQICITEERTDQQIYLLLKEACRMMEVSLTKNQ